jgi:serine phosphatase RsbU (regulator of sigma subunit)
VPGQIAARFAIFDEAGEPLPYKELPAFRALAGEQHPGPRLVRNVVLATGEERWLLNKVSVLRDADGNVDRIVNVIEDVTQVKQAEVRERLLGEATRLLSGAGGREDALTRLAAVVVPELAAWCEVCTRAGGERETIARAGRDRAAGDEHLTVPAVAAGTELATIVLGRERRFAAEETRMVEELGHRAGIALLNMRLSAEQAEITRELQDGLRPPDLPEIPGVQTATLYRPAGELNDVGGDYYDAFPTATDWTVVIGDVAGQGARAAALTGLTRFTLRSVAQYAGAQHDAMSAVNRALAEQSDMALCTLAVLRLSPAEDGGVTLGSLSAGHPLPVLLRDGQASELGAPGPIAGVFDDAAWDTATIALRDGDTLVLYTDGVLDTVGSDGRFGPERLLDLLRGTPADPQALVDRVAAALAEYQSGPQRDDTAIVALTVRDVGALAAAIGQVHASA